MSISPPPAPAPAPPVLASLPLLPSELLLKIFAHLDPGNSICLGLTCKRLYLIHRSLHGSVRLETRVVAPLSPSPGPRLYELLEEWHLPGFEMCWCGHSRVRTARVSFSCCFLETFGGRRGVGFWRRMEQS